MAARSRRSVKRVRLSLTPLEATMLFLAASEPADNLSQYGGEAAYGWTGTQVRAWGRAIDKLQAGRRAVGVTE